MGVIDGEAVWVTLLRLIGHADAGRAVDHGHRLDPAFGTGRSNGDIERIMDRALGPICAVLVTGAGGRGVCASVSTRRWPAVWKRSGADRGGIRDLDRAQGGAGSATVALTTTAGLIAPTVAATTGLSSDLCFLVIAIACGATVLKPFQRFGFWLVGRFLNMDGHARDLDDGDALGGILGWFRADRLVAAAASRRGAAPSS
ncbi:MAG: hypothetical protein U1E55_02710 [Paracoccus sp. (in: a-proteobacteria)]